jgi:aspartate aminotransferase
MHKYTERTMNLAQRSNIEPSLTLAMNTKAKQMRAAGVDVISFAAGEPDFPTPEHIKSAGKRAIDEDKTYYTPASGIVELKQQVVQKLERENGLSYGIDQISINSGAKHSVFNSLFALVEEGDEVIVPSPYWVSYSEMVRLCGATPVFVRATEETDFKLSPDRLKEALTNRTKVLLINSPCNPTGAVYSRDELFSLAAVVENKELVVISDEIYEKILYEGNEHVSIASYSPELKERTVVINGMSKAFSMTGWRIGYAAGPKSIIDAINAMQGHTSGNPTSISQWASVSGLEKDSEFIRQWVEEFRKRRDYIVRELNRIDGVACTTPGGAFYVFPGVRGLFGRTYQGVWIDNDLDLCYFLLEKAHIALVPGKAFGAEGYVRLSFATSMENIVEGLKRMKEAVA